MFRSTLGKAVVAAGLFAAMLPSTSQALTLQSGLTPRVGVTWNNIVAGSVDPVGALAYVAALAPYVDQQAYNLSNTFDGGPLGSNFDSLLLTEIAGNSVANVLDLCKPGDDCSNLFVGSDAPGEIANINLVSGLQQYFRLTGPGGVFFSDATRNPLEDPHFVAFKVVAAGSVNITPTTLSGGSVMINLLPGDLIIGIEDLPLYNMLACQQDPQNCVGLMGASGDRDYNDMLFHARVNEIPEPATLSLLGLGALGLRPFLRRKKAA